MSVYPPEFNKENYTNKVTTNIDIFECFKSNVKVINIREIKPQIQKIRDKNQIEIKIQRKLKDAQFFKYLCSMFKTLNEMYDFLVIVKSIKNMIEILNTQKNIKVVK